MPVPDWPSTLPQRVLREGYSRKDAVREIGSEMDDGRIVGRLSSDINAVIDTVSFDMNSSQANTFWAFYRDDIGRGTVRFTMPTLDDDATYTSRTVKMLRSDDSPSRTDLGGGWQRISFTIKVFL